MNPLLNPANPTSPLNPATSPLFDDGGATVVAEGGLSGEMQLVVLLIILIGGVIAAVSVK